MKVLVAGANGKIGKMLVGIIRLDGLAPVFALSGYYLQKRNSVKNL
ncbi:UNVERIFIED_ORG: dihydrodipicolinate reductase [Heyndrickxia coagulans]